MSAKDSLIYKSQPWHAGYMAALFETDRTQIRGRIRQAELLIVSREHELHAGDVDVLEQHALNSALHALRALRTCLGLDV